MIDADFEFLTRFLHERSGIALSKDKAYLVESRLLPLVRSHKFADLGELIGRLRFGSDAVLAEEVIDAMTTNETFFFRDKVPFDRFTEVMLPQLIKARATERRLRIWCAACSTGQEPYSLAMLLKERAAQLPGWKIEIVATDLSPTVIDRARAGVYTQFEVQRGLPIQLLLKYFEQKGEKWEISPVLKPMVQFRTLNLLRDFSSLGRFDIVFCRNVLIYFDERTRGDIMERIARLMAPDGYLTLGAAETVIGLTNAFAGHSEHRGLYQPSRSVSPQPVLARIAG
ncbi:chemotaxis protein methyltransferase [Agaricicola taiwanensis]|uniref:Chemotaxis protein methyltransferase n=1 Tax=Agaricicola taiwanensis TaxID=591372 RepID=A0A8J2VVX4_9RHOB|nr:protein-glutamate O-methyltransferase CheR [Agaricicola taiwanensis]GGE39563.1 chemotaxis protein methyltransferase [Agaricicola taiwanensis]